MLLCKHLHIRQRAALKTLLQTGLLLWILYVALMKASTATLQMKEQHELKCEVLLELPHTQKSEAGAVGEAREGRGRSLASALANFPLCHYSHWPGLRVWLTFCVPSTSAATCAETVWRGRLDAASEGASRLMKQETSTSTSWIPSWPETPARFTPAQTTPPEWKGSSFVSEIMFC